MNPVTSKIKEVLALAVCVGALTACSNPFHNPFASKPSKPEPTIRLTLVPYDTVAPGKTVKIEAKLNDIASRTLITEDRLDTVHTQKFHLLVVDPTLTDYQHIHPVPTGTPGLYSFQFTPEMNGGYRAWADVTPAATHRQEFAMADIGTPRGGNINRTESHDATVDGYRFTLTFDTVPKADGESMGTITVTDRNGHPVNTLEPVMGAFVHIVGFYDDLRTVVHTHAMGKEPKSDKERGGPELTFHLMPEKPGFLKLFAQVKINGKELFAPFGINVAKAK